MNMTRYRMGCLLSLLTLAVNAQQIPVPVAMTQSTAPAAAPATTAPPRVFVSPAEVAQIMAKAEAGPKDGTQLPAAARQLVSWGPLNGNLIYRSAPTTLYFANEDYAEFYVILEGDGTMNVGGTMTNPKRTGYRLESPALQGGVAYKVTKGAMLMVPPGTAHRVTEVRGRLVYMSMHIPLQPGSGTGLKQP